MIYRQLINSLEKYKKKYPVIAITGPRQSGKTTLLKNAFPDYRYLSLENPDIRNFAENDPNGFLLQYSGNTILDEVQRVPSLFSYLQTQVDDNEKMGQYILSGSQNFHLMQGITQSLAGRVAIFRLFPFDFWELKNAGLMEEHYAESLLKGYYPAIFDRKIPSKIFYQNYIDTYVQRDISQLIGIKNHRYFKNFLALCATRAGQLLNLNSLARECGISQPTAKSWLSALESSYIVFQLFPWHKNLSKRIVKTPKLYFYDSGLLCHLLKIADTSQFVLHPLKGNLFENMIIAELVKHMNHTYELFDIWFYRDSSGREVDLIIEKGRETHLCEIKAGHTIMPEMFKNLNWLSNALGDKRYIKTVVYGGNENQKRKAGNVLSWTDFGK